MAAGSLPARIVVPAPFAAGVPFPPANPAASAPKATPATNHRAVVFTSLFDAA
jgi:hypothetical protein